MNILYLDDYINLYYYKNKEIISRVPYKGTLQYGLIINKKKFIKSFSKLLLEKNIKSSLIKETIMVIINRIWTTRDKELIKDILLLFNYKKVVFVNEISYLNINKKEVYINYNLGYFYLSYIDDYGEVITSVYDNSLVNKSIITCLLKKINKEVMCYGNNTKELLEIINNINKEYYVYKDSSNFILKTIIYSKENFWF